MLLSLCGLASVVLGYVLWMRREKLRRVALGVGLVVELCLLVVVAMLLPNPIVLQKVLVQLFMPVGFFWLLLLGFTGYWWHRQRRKQAVIGGVVAFLYLVLGNGLISGMLFDWIERDYHHVRPLTAKPFDAVLVLGGATKLNHHGMAYLTGAGDRVMLAARMYYQKRTPILVASGSNLPGTIPENHATETAQIWRSLQIPQRAILNITGPYNTKTEVQAYKKLIAQRGWKRVGLITSAWHMRRTMRLCRAMGVKVHPLPADFQGGSRGVSPWLAWNIPSGGGFAASHTVLWELLGALVGR